MQHLETFESASAILGKDAKLLPLIDGIDQKHAKAIIAIFKLFVISEAAWKVEDKEIDWNNDEQRKYYPWFDMESASGSAGGFSFYGCFYDRSVSDVGSRLVFPSMEICEYVAKTHIDLYKDLMVL